MPPDIDSPDKHKRLSERLKEAEALASRVLVTQPENPDALNSLGLVHLQQENFDDAIGFFDKAHKICPERSDFIANLIKALDSLAKRMTLSKNFSAAIAILHRALSMRPQDTTLACRISFVLSLAKRNDEALVAADRALSGNAKSAQAHDVRGLALLGLGRIEHSMESFRAALDCDIEYASAYSNLGLAYRAQGDTETAIKCFAKACGLQERNPQAYNNLGISFLDVNDLRQAEIALNKALAIEPDYAEAHFNLSRVLLMAEDFEAGWKQNEWRWQCSEFPSTWREFPLAMWEGEDLNDKKVLVWSEQGVGDEIMFANTLPELVENSAGVIIECNARLVPIFERSFAGVNVVARQDPAHYQIKEANIDYQIPMGSICKFYRRNAENFPSEPRGYLKSDPDLTAEIKARYANLGDGMKVGISWRSGNPIVGHERSIPLELWSELLSSEGCQFINLQYGDVAEDLASILMQTGAKVFKDEAVDPLTNAEEWFAQIAALDHVVSVDNSTIQVSGSLGVPTWALLSEMPEWRFGLKRLDHLWHPSIRVFRQPKKGEWKFFMQELAITFSDFVKNTTISPNFTGRI